MGFAPYHLTLTWLTETPWDMGLPAQQSRLDQPWLMVCAIAGRALVRHSMV